MTEVGGQADAVPSVAARSNWSVDYVRVLVGGGSLRYQAVGCTRSRRIERPLSPEAASQLIGQVPFVVRRAAGEA